MAWGLAARGGCWGGGRPPRARARACRAPALSPPAHRAAALSCALARQAKLRAFASAVDAVAAAAQRLPTKSEALVGGLQFGQGALRPAAQALLASAGTFRGRYAAAFPRVAQMAGGAGR